MIDNADWLLSRMGGRGTPSVYGYAGGDPIGNSDPDGLDVKSEVKVRGPIEVAGQPIPGKDGATKLGRVVTVKTHVFQAADGTYGFRATVKAEITVEIRKGQADQPSGDEEGMTLIGHEYNHVKDLTRGLNGLNARIKTEGFRRREDAERARAGFERSVYREVERSLERTARRDRK